MPRLFIAIDLADEQKNTLSTLQDPSLSVHWTSPARYHLTLRFIGEVGVDTQVLIEETLAPIHASSFLLESYSLNVFPSLRMPRVVFLAIVPSPALMHLHWEVNQALDKIGIVPDAKPFRPHITIARVKEASVSEIRALLRSHQSFRLTPFLVSHFHLYKSLLQSAGAQHIQLRTFELGVA